MASAKKSSPPAKGASKATSPAPASGPAGASSGKSSPAKPKPSASAPAPKPSGKPAAADAPAPSPTPAIKIERAAGRDTLCQIEILKDGHFFIARTETEAGSKEYKNTVFEDMLTEMVITLQEQLSDK